MDEFSKGPVSGFVGIIPLPTLESRIDRKLYIGANYFFLFKILSPIRSSSCLKDVGSLL